MANPRISLIVPAYNEEAYIGRCLESVNRARDCFGEPSLIETIVVDNDSSDDTREIASRYMANVVSEEKRQIASVRNRGASEASGEILGFLDADSTVTPNMFVAIDDAMSTGRYIGGGTDVRFDRNSPGILATFCISVFPARWLLGIAVGLMFTGHETFLGMGGFDESMYCAEDSRFVLDLKRYGKQRGRKFKVITDARVTTSARSFDTHGDWFYFRNLPGFLSHPGRATRDKRFCDRFWYDVER